MNSTRGGLPYLDFFGTSSGSTKSLLHAGSPYKITIKPLGQLGMDSDVIAYGDSLTWNFLASLRIKWGNSTTLQFPIREPGWRYEWEVGSKRLIVINDIGQVTYYGGKDTLSSLGVCWDILQSHQFSIVLNGTYDKDVFLIGTRQVERNEVEYNTYCFSKGAEDPDYPGKPGDKDHPWITSDDSENFWRTGIESPMTVYNYTEYEKLSNVLFSKLCMEDIASIGNWSFVGYEEEGSVTGVRLVPDKTAELRTFKVLMIYHLVKQIYDATQPVLEPWMLWEVWKWLGKGKSTDEDDRVFELSPWWG